MKRLILLSSLAIFLFLNIPAFAQFGNATRLQGREVSPTAPSDTNVLCWSASSKEWLPCGNGGSGVATCSTDPPTSGAAGSFCSTSTGLYQCQNGVSACTTSAQWVQQMPIVGVAILPPVSAAVPWIMYRMTAATNQNACPVGGDSGGTATAYCMVNHAGTGYDVHLVGDSSGNVSLPGTLSIGTAVLAWIQGFRISWVDADTLSVAAGSVVFPGGGSYGSVSAQNVTFAALDTGTRTLGVDYYVWVTTAGIKLSAITVSGGATAPSGYTSANSQLLGYFHNGVSVGGVHAYGAIFQYSVTNNSLINFAYPYRAMPDLPAGVPLPGMVKVGNLAIGIYEASADDATPTAAGSSSYPTSRYGVVPIVSVTGWSAMQMAAQAGARLPTWAEWLMAVEFNPGSRTVASQNGNTNSGASFDDATQTCTADPTLSGRCLTGTGPRTNSWTGAAAGSSWYSPAGLADAVGNVWEWVAQFFGGLNTGGQGVSWGYQGDYAYNFLGSAYNPDTGGYTAGLPAMLIVGGAWNDGSSAGVRAALANNSASHSDYVIGFRLAR